MPPASSTSTPSKDSTGAIAPLDVKQVSDRTTLSRNTIWGLERAGGFPRRRQTTANKVAWLESEVDAWIASRPTAVEARESSG